MVSAVTVVVHELDETLQWLQEQAKLFGVPPEGGRVEDGRDLVGVAEVHLLEAVRDGDLLEDGAEEQEALQHVVHTCEARRGGDDDRVVGPVRGVRPSAELGHAELAVLEELRDGHGLADDPLGPRVTAYVLEEEGPAMGSTSCAQDVWMLPEGRREGAEGQ